MTTPPLPTLVLGFAGLIPFVFGALASLGLTGVSPFTGALVLQAYGAAILAFMGGCLWGFAAAAGRTGYKELGLSVIPGLWAFSATFSPDALLSLLTGFIVLLVQDMMFGIWKLTPPWWMRLRLPLTAGAVICLGIGAMA